MEEQFSKQDIKKKDCVILEECKFKMAFFSTFLFFHFLFFLSFFLFFSKRIHQNMYQFYINIKKRVLLHYHAIIMLIIYCKVIELSHATVLNTPLLSSAKLFVRQFVDPNYPKQTELLINLAIRNNWLE